MDTRINYNKLEMISMPTRPSLTFVEEVEQAIKKGFE